MPLDELIDGLREVQATEGSAVALAIAYLVLAIRQNVLCWFAAFLSSLIYLAVFFQARLYMESALQIFYAGMAVYGYYEWKHGGAEHAGVRITTWNPWQHARALGAIAFGSVVAGWLLSHTNAAYPYADSFTTTAAILTTYMVARKILENWLYWFVIDGVSVYLYLSRGLVLTAALFVLYLVLIVIGFRRWWLEWRHA